MPRFCKECGTELNDENVKFCPKCGTAVQQNAAPNSNQSTGSYSTTYPEVTCPRCGSTNLASSTNCLKCGYRLAPKDYKGFIIAGYACLVIGIFLFGPVLFGSIGIGIYLLTRDDYNDKLHPIILIGVSVLVLILAIIALISLMSSY